MRNLHWLILLLFVVQLYSCKEFIELPVTDKKVIMNAPGENLQTDKYTQLFWWEPVEDATAYRLQIVNPNFENIASLILDTLSFWHADRTFGTDRSFSGEPLQV